MTGTEDKKEPPVLTARDERDIAKDLNRIMEKLSAGEEGPASYDGEELDPEAAELFRDELDPVSYTHLDVYKRQVFSVDIKHHDIGTGKLCCFLQNLRHGL